MRKNIQTCWLPCLFLLLALTILGCRSEPEGSSNSGITASLPKFGSEVETDGVKSRLFGCLPEDQGCLKRSDITTKLGCDWVSDKDCAGCSKLDLICLVGPDHPFPEHRILTIAEGECGVDEPARVDTHAGVF